MNTFAMYMGYIFMAILAFCVSICIIYWIYKLYLYLSFTFKYYRITQTYFYKIVHEGKWKDAYSEGTRAYIEYYYVKRRKRYHIFSKFETLYKLNTAQEAENFLNSHINMFPG